MSIPSFGNVKAAFDVHQDTTKCTLMNWEHANGAQDTREYTTFGVGQECHTKSYLGNISLPQPDSLALLKDVNSDRTPKKKFPVKTLPTEVPKLKLGVRLEAQIQRVALNHGGDVVQTGNHDM